MNGVDFLCKLERALKRRRALRSEHHSCRRACVSAIFRIRPKAESVSLSTSGPNVSVFSAEQLLEQEWVRGGTVQILFIKRAVNPNDRWSGQVAFPGGRRQESDSDDQATAQRETMEEISLDLSNRNNYICLGQIDDFNVMQGKGSGGLVLSCWIFLQVTPSTPPLRLHEKEVAAFRWVDVTSLYKSPRLVTLTFPIKSMYPDIKTSQQILASLGLDPVRLPAVHLPPTLPSVDANEDTNSAFTLWGLTLGRFGELLELTRLPRPDRPPMATNNVVANHLIRYKYGNRSSNGLELKLFSYELSLVTAFLLGMYFELRARL